MDSGTTGTADDKRSPNRRERREAIRLKGLPKPNRSRIQRKQGKRK